MSPWRIPKPASQPSGSGERQLGALPALEGDGQPHDEEDLPVDRQDDDAVRLEQLGQPAHAGMVRGR